MKRATHDIAQLLEMLADLNSIGALDGFLFAAVRSSGEAPIFGRVCDKVRAFELLGGAHLATFALANTINGDAELIDGPEEEPPHGGFRGREGS